MAKSPKTTEQADPNPEVEVPDVANTNPNDPATADAKPEDQPVADPATEAQTDEEAKLAAEEAAKAPKEYTVAEGVAWVNGKKVPADRRVFLTDVEAAFDKGLGRITLADTPKASAD